LNRAIYQSDCCVYFKDNSTNKSIGQVAQNTTLLGCAVDPFLNLRCSLPTLGKRHKIETVSTNNSESFSPYF